MISSTLLYCKSNNFFCIFLNAKVRLVAPKSIARSEGKAVRIIDKRKL